MSLENLATLRTLLCFLLREQPKVLAMGLVTVAAAEQTPPKKVCESFHEQQLTSSIMTALNPAHTEPSVLSVVFCFGDLAPFLKQERLPRASQQRPLKLVALDFLLCDEIKDFSLAVWFPINKEETWGQGELPPPRTL